MITIDNYEEYLVMHADGELQPHEEEALRVFLNDHPHLQNELLVYQQVRMVPDETIIYTQKESLIQPEPKRGIIFTPNWRTLSIAAGIAAVILITVAVLRNGNDADKPVVVNNNTTINTANSNTTTKPATTNPQPANTDTPLLQENVAIAPASNATNNDNNNNNSNTPVPNSQVNNTPRGQQNNTDASRDNDVAKNNDTKKPAGHDATQVTANPVFMTAVAATDFKKLPVATAPANTPNSNVPVDGYSLADAAPEAVKSWIDKLPLNDEKKEQLNTIANAVAYGIDKVTDIKSNVSDKKLTVKVEKRRLILSF